MCILGVGYGVSLRFLFVLTHILNVSVKNTETTFKQWISLGSNTL